MGARHDVIVVGGGVAGAAMAVALSRQGLDVALVERGGRPAPFDAAAWDPRVYALSPGTVRFLDRIGAWSRIAARRVGPYERMRVWENDPSRALEFAAGELGVPELGYIVEENLIRDVLWSLLAGVAVRTGAGAVGLQPGEHGARLALDGGETVDAALVVAAEGGDSNLRKLAGIEPVGWPYSQRAIVSHVETGQPHGRTAFQRFLPNGPLAFLPLPDGRSSIVWSTEDAEAQQLLALPDDAFRARLAEAFDRQLGDIGAISRRFSFPLRLMHAQQYVRPGFALVGDSAHVVHPMAGQGINLGLADVEALADLVAEAREERRPFGSLRFLKKYERRRKADNVEMLALTDALYRLFKVRAPALSGAREWGMQLVGRSGLLKRELALRAMNLA